MTQAQTAASQGYVLGTNEGEHLVHFRDAELVEFANGVEPCWTAMR